MVKLAKRIKAVVCASILVASTAIASLVPATQVKAALTGSISIVEQDEYNAGGTVKIKTSFTDATKVTYEFYSQSFNPYYPYYGYGTRKFTVEETLSTSPRDVVIDIPSNARGTYTVKAVFENTTTGDKTTVTAPTKLSVKNSSYDKSMAYYYYLNGNSGSISDPYLYYLLSDDENTDKNALLYYYYLNNNSGSSTVPSWYYYYLLDDDEDNDNNALLYYYYMNNNSTSSTVPSWYYYYLLDDDEDNDNDALLYYYYLNNTSSTTPSWYYYYLLNK